MSAIAHPRNHQLLLILQMGKVAIERILAGNKAQEIIRRMLPDCHKSVCNLGVGLGRGENGAPPLMDLNPMTCLNRHMD